MENVSKFKLGVFVSIGMTLFAILIFYVAIREAIQPHGRVVTIFRESVQGLEKGSQVKYKGVTIGSVSDVFIMTSDENRLIQVEMEINFDALRSEDPKKLRKMFYEFIQRERERGLRCRLEFAGITGQKYIEMDYFDGEKSLNSPIEQLSILNKEDQRYFLPSSPSLFKGLLKQLTTSLTNIAEIDFGGISSDLRKSIQSADKLISSPKIASTVSELENSSRQLTILLEKTNEAFDVKDVRAILNDINKVIKEADDLIALAKADLKKAKVGETTASFRNAANSITGTKDNVNKLLLQIELTVASLNELINKINDDPSSLLRGKQLPRALDEVKSIREIK